MSNPPVPLLQLLRHLQETTAGVDKLRFLVDTSEGLRLLSLEEALKLIPLSVQVTCTHECMDRTHDHKVVQQLFDQLQTYNEKLEVLQQSISDLAAIEYTPIVNTDTPLPIPKKSVALGLDALLEGALDHENIGIGLSAGKKLEGVGNVLIGSHSGFESEGVMTDVTGVGHYSLTGLTDDLENVTAIGAYSRPTGNHQVVLGDQRTTTYTHTSPHRRSDVRDMYQPRPLELGLDFVLNVQPIQYQQDFRESYVDWSSKPSKPLDLRTPPTPPTLPITDSRYQSQVIAYRADKAQWEREKKQHIEALAQYHIDLEQWIDAHRLHRLRSNGDQRGTRIHIGFNSNQLMEIAKRADVDLALVQDHSVNGGESVKTHSDGELLAILWHSVQQLYAKMHSSTFVDSLASALQQRHTQIVEQTVSERTEPN
jgi:hypothetical protein